MIYIAGAWNGGRVFSGRQAKYSKAPDFISIGTINRPTDDTYMIKKLFSNV